MIGKLRDIFRGRDGEWIFSLSTPTDPRALFDQLSDKMVKIDIKEYRQQRSLEANAYCWVLIDKIAEKTGLSKVEVYRHAIKEIGGVSDIICVQDKAVERLISGWEKNGIGWMTDTFPSRLDGCTNVILYYGSSVYDTKQMSQLIDSLIQEAEGLGIPTISEKEEQEMLGKWSKKHETQQEHSRV